MKRSLTLIVFFLFAIASKGQGTTQGTDFWVAFLHAQENPSIDSPIIYVTAKRACTVTFSNPSTGFSRTKSITANGYVKFTAEGLARTGIFDIKAYTAVHVQSSDSVEVFTFHGRPGNTYEAARCIPTPSLGSTYRVITHPASPFSFPPPAIWPLPQTYVIVAAEDNTDIAFTRGAGGAPTTIQLNKGQTYQVISSADLTGSTVRVMNSCKKIAVVAGVEYDLGTDPDCMDYGKMYEQMLPVETWGKSYYFNRTRYNDKFKIMAHEDNTKIVVDFSTITLNGGQVYTSYTTDDPTTIFADKPVLVAAYSSKHCPAGTWDDSMPVGDLSMYLVPPLEQMSKTGSAAFIRTPSIGDSQFVNIVMRTGDTSNFTVNGIKTHPKFLVYNSIPQYAHVTIQLTDTIALFACDSGMIGTAFGYSYSKRFSDQYAYPLGMSFNNLIADLPIPYQVTGRTFVHDTVPLCRGFSYNFNLMFPYDTRSWTFDSTEKAGNTPSYIFQDTGLQQVNIRLTYPWVCTLRDTIKHVRVIDSCFKARPDTAMCKGTTVQLYAKSQGLLSDTCFSYQWFIRNNNMGIGKVGVFPIVTTQYTVIFTDKCLKIKDTSYVNVGIFLPLTITMSRDTSICYGNSVRVSAKAGGSDSNYIYNWVSGLTGTGFSDSLVGPTTTTTYGVAMKDICKTKPDTAYTRVTVGPPLRLSVSPDTIMCEGQTARLTATGTGGDYSYLFFWDHSLGVIPSVTVKPTQTTTYRVILDDECSPYRDTGYVTVHVRPRPEVDVSPDIMLCEGQSTTLDAYGKFGDSTYIFTWDNGMGNASSITVTPDQTTTYQVKIDDQCSPAIDSAKVTVYIRPPLQVSMNSDTLICVGESARISGLATGGDSSYIYSWSPVTGNTANRTVNPGATTTYQLIVNDNCSLNADTGQVTVYVRPPITLVTSNDTTVCPGGTASLNAIASGGDSSYTYNWDRGLGTGPSKQDQVNTNTTYKVTVSDGCSPDASATIDALVEIRPNIAFTPDPAHVCIGDSTRFKNLTTGPSTYTYVWHFGDGDTDAGQDPAHLYRNTGQYNVKLIVTSARQCVDSHTVNNSVFVHPPPTASFTSTPPVTDLLKPTIKFTNTSTKVASYEWDFGDTYNSSIEHPTHNYGDTGTYIVTLIVTSSEHCTDTTTGIIRINDYYRLFIPNAFSPNGDDINDKFELKGRGIHAYQINIYNRWGEMVFTSSDISQSWDGSVPGRTRPSPDGMYYYMVEVLDLIDQRHHHEGNITLIR